MTGLTLTSTTDSVTATWTKDDVCELIETFEVKYDGVVVSGIVNTEVSDVKPGLTACQLVAVEIYAMYNEGSSTNVLSSTTTTQAAG